MINIAVIGCDSTHVEAYTFALNNSKLNKRAKVISVWDKSFELASKKANELNIPLVGKTIKEAINKADAILLLNRFGEERFEFAKEIIKVKKPVFADKPLTMDMREDKDLVNLYNSKGVPLFSSSAFRFAEETDFFCKSLEYEKIIGGTIIGPFQCNDLGPDPRLKNIFFYGVHITEVLQEIFGTGIDSVNVCNISENGYTATILFSHGLCITMQLLNQVSDYYSATVFTDSGPKFFTLNLEGNYYERTLKAFLDFTDGNYLGVPLKNTLEALQMLFALEESAKTGETVSLAPKK